MLQRWATRRFFEQDVVSRDACTALIKHLSAQDYESSGTEPWSGSDRADVFTYHSGKGRGVRWKDTPRQMLWLSAFDAKHDRGYEYAEELQDDGRLYPDLDPDWQPGGAQTAAPWGAYLDEDNYEWARLIYGALLTWEINQASLADGQRVDYFPSSVYLSLQQVEDDIWTLLTRRNLGYMAGSDRGRFMTTAELHALLHHIARDGDGVVYEESAPPGDLKDGYLFVQFDFFGGPVSPSAWLERVAAAALSGKALLHINR